MSDEFKFKVTLAIIDEKELMPLKEFRISLSKNQIVIVGRSKEAQLPLDDDNLSRKHFYFSIKDKQVYINDMDSKNGTFINKRMTESSPIKENDYISAGNHLLLIKRINKLKL